MSKRIVALTVFLAVLLMAASPGRAVSGALGKGVFAVEITAEKNTGEHDGSDLDGVEIDCERGDVLTPDSFCYFCKRVLESFQVLFTFNGGKKADLLARFAAERARELAALERKFTGREISDAQAALLARTWEDLLTCTEKYAEQLMKGQPDDNPAEAECGKQYTDDKYQQRIAHLRQLAAGEANSQNELAKLIANAERQRARLIARGILSDKIVDDDSFEFSLLQFTKFELEIEAGDCELEVEFEQEKRRAEASIEVEGGDEDVELKGSAAMAYLFPILESLEIDPSMSNKHIAQQVLAAFEWDIPYEKIELEVKFADGAKLDFAYTGEIVEPSLPYREFELEIKCGGREFSAEYEWEHGKVEAEVEIEDGRDDTELKGSAALDYLLPILEGLEIDSSMAKKQIVQRVLAAFAWEGHYDEIEIEVKFADGSEIDIEDESEDKGDPESSLPYREFELEIESDDREFSVELEQEKGKITAEVEIEQERGEDTELKGSAALAYLLPILETLEIDSSMAKKQIVQRVLAAFAWEGRYDEFELEVRFTDGSKIDIEIDN